MTKKGFTLMELLVSIFISGMVMLSLVAMWKTSSNHTAQAQRQSIIRNESTIFLRRLYNDFISASEIICPWAYTKGGPACSKHEYIAVKEAVLDYGDIDQLVRITEPVCGSGGNSWADEENLQSISSRCIRPSYSVYVYEDNTVFRCQSNFLTDSKKIDLKTLVNTAHAYCSASSGNREIVMPYVSNFILTGSTSGSDKAPELLIDYTVDRNFGPDVPPVHFRFKRLLTLRRGM